MDTERSSVNSSKELIMREKRANKGLCFGKIDGDFFNILNIIWHSNTTLPPPDFSPIALVERIFF